MIYIKGGTGSGNFGHAGRPDQIGGSASYSASVNAIISNVDYSNISGIWDARKKVGTLEDITED